MTEPKSELYKNHRRCKSCDYWADKSEWTVLTVSSSDGRSNLLCREYKIKDKVRIHVGSVDLLSCPQCRTVIWER